LHMSIGHFMRSPRRVPGRRSSRPAFRPTLNPTGLRRSPCREALGRLGKLEDALRNRHGGVQSDHLHMIGFQRYLRYLITCIEGSFASNFVKMLWCVGSRCWIRTKGMPVFTGKARSNSVSASIPPADAPMSAIKNRSGRPRPRALGVASRGRACPTWELSPLSVSRGIAERPAWLFRFHSGQC